VSSDDSVENSHHVQPQTTTITDTNGIFPVPKRRNVIDSYTDQTQAHVSDDDLILIEEITNKKCSDVIVIDSKSEENSKKSKEISEDSDDDFNKWSNDVAKDIQQKIDIDSKKPSTVSLTDNSNHSQPANECIKQQSKNSIAIVKQHNPSNDQVTSSKYFKKDTTECTEQIVEEPVLGEYVIKTI
jgi:hypothetical protein